MALQVKDNMTVSQPSSGLTHYRQENGIFVFRLHNNRREAFDAMINQAYQNELIAHGEGSSACFLVDVRGQWITPYAVVRLIQTSNNIPAGLEEWIAIVSGDNFASRMIESALRRFPSSVRLSARVFLKEEPALAWLEQRQREFNDAKTTT